LEVAVSTVKGLTRAGRSRRLRSIH